MLQPFDSAYPGYWTALQGELLTALHGFLPDAFWTAAEKQEKQEEAPLEQPELSSRFLEALSRLPHLAGAEERPDEEWPEDGSPVSRKAGLFRSDLGSDLDRDLARELAGRDESFSQMLVRKIEELGLSSAECYRRANVDRKLFSKIKSDPQYRPRKETALAFAIALELDLEETGELLKKAGFALTRSKPQDIIVEFFIQKKVYDIHLINAALFHYDQSLLGGL